MRKSILGRFPVTNYSAAFTLVEILVVIVVLATIGAGVVSFINPRGQLDKARDVQRKNDTKQLQNALDAYYDDFKCYPEALSSLTSGSKKYIKVLPTPPQGGSYGSTYVRETSGCPQWYVLLADHTRPLPSETVCPDGIRTGCLATSYSTNFSCVYGGSVACPAAPAPTATPTPGGGGGPPVATPTPPTIDPVYGSGSDGILEVFPTPGAAPGAVSFNINTQTNGYLQRSCEDGVQFRVLALTQNTATVNFNPSALGGCLKPNDEVMLINFQGTPGSNGNVGNYQLFRVASVTNNPSGPHVVTFTNDKGATYYGDNLGDDTLTNQRVMLQRVPNYDKVIVHPGAVLSGREFNSVSGCTVTPGTRGGVLAFKATGTVGILGDISMSAKGYKGGKEGATGFSGSNSNKHGLKGETTSGAEALTNCGGANKVGDYQETNNPGGGGGGQGIYTGPPAGGTATAGSGGGGNFGGTATNGTHGNTGATTLYSGLGAGVYGNSALSKLFAGSGGGGGGSSNDGTAPSGGSQIAGGRGGHGGGIIYIAGKNIVGSGAIQANGEDGVKGGRKIHNGKNYDSGSGGGGSGGSINIDSSEFGFDNTQIQVNGGSGGSSNAAIAGNGGKGRARVDSTSSLFRNLVSYWKMDEASGTTMVRDSNARNNGVSSHAGNVGTGKILNARTFVPGTLVTIGDNNGLEASGNYSVSFWTKTATTQYTSFFFKDDIASAGKGWTIAITNVGKLSALFGSVNLTGNKVVNDDNWHHVVVTKSTSGVFVYVDSVLDVSSTANPGDLSSTGDLYFGSGFNGSIDEVGIWLRALSASEIGSLYASGNGKTYPLDPSSTVYLAASPSSIVTGNLTVKWNNIQIPSGTDWIGLYPTAAPDSPRPAGWMRVGCSQFSTNAVTTGSCAYPAPGTSGNYQFRLFGNDTTSNPIAKSNGVSVNAPTPTPTPIPNCTSSVSCSGACSLPATANTCSGLNGTGTSCVYTGPAPCTQVAAPNQANYCTINNCNAGYTCVSGSCLLNVTCYRDADSDSHGNPSVTTTVFGSCPAGYVASPADDCNDGASNVYGGNSNYYTSSGANGWDYNCSGSVEMNYPEKLGSPMCSSGSITFWTSWPCSTIRVCKSSSVTPATSAECGTVGPFVDQGFGNYTESDGTGCYATAGFEYRSTFSPQPVLACH